MSKFKTALLLVTASLMLVACGDADGEGANNQANNGQTNNGQNNGTGDCPVECAEGTVCDADLGHCRVEVQQAQCNGTGTSWSPGNQAFEDASAAWNLEEANPEGQRISVGDFNGDGRPDLAIRRAGVHRNQFSDGNRAVWLLENTGDGFEDVTEASELLKSRVNINEGRPVDTLVWADVDNDGDQDAYTGFSKTESSDAVEDSAEIMLNKGDGTFTLTGLANGARRGGEPDVPGGAAFVDVNRDGNIDLWLGQGAAGNSVLQDRLLLGDGEGGFEDATESYGLTTEPWRDIEELNQALAHTNSWGAVACDLNNDGTTELLSASYGRAPNHLWQGSAPGSDLSFTNRSVESGYAYDDRTDWSDNESARCYCNLNPDAEGCDGVPEPELIECDSGDDVFRWRHSSDRELYRLGGNSGTTVCEDIDGDGNMDLLTSEIVHWDVGSSSDPSEILYNQGESDVTFERPGPDATGVDWEHDMVAWNDGDITAAIFDFDNDARPDVYIGSTDYPGTRGHLFHQKEDGTFEEVSIGDGIHQKSSHGIGVADFDQDGDLDVVVGHSAFRCGSGDHCYPAGERHARIWENTIGQDGNWIQLDLVGGEDTNLDAIGARVTVETPERTQAQEVDGGHGHYGVQDAKTLHFGLGDACKAVVTVRWPDADLTEQTFVLTPGYRYELEQGKVPVAR
jgi:hypothetical protein